MTVFSAEHQCPVWGSYSAASLKGRPAALGRLRRLLLIFFQYACMLFTEGITCPR